MHHKKNHPFTCYPHPFGGMRIATFNIQKAYVSPLQYQGYDCTQIATELRRVTTHATTMQTNLQKTADNDTAQMTVGLILFWPTLFFLEGGDGPEAAEYARLKGERDALEQIAIQKKCSLDILPVEVEQKSEEPKTVKKQDLSKPQKSFHAAKPD
jgi:hypothetical protein